MKLRLSLCAASLALVLPLAACAEMPGGHPGYLRALTDLRDARWCLAHRPGDEAVRAEEDIAITEVDRAINELKNAAIDDGKNIYKHPPEDASLDGPGRLRHAIELLKKARDDISGEEDNPESRELRHHAMEHIDAAINATKGAKFDSHHH